MIAFDDLLHRLKRLDRRELIRWVENRWVLPERQGQTWIFHDVDVARVELILEIRHEFAIDDEALPLVLGRSMIFGGSYAACATRWQLNRPRCRR
jgi:chaperone modulatory protein CbpM